MSNLLIEEPPLQVFPSLAVALWLRDRRKRRGLTVRALAEKAGVSHPRISQIEGRANGRPRTWWARLFGGSRETA